MSKNIPIVQWQVNGTDDFIFRHENYCLRVEQMDKLKYWWWCVYYNKDILGFGNPKATTELEAKLLAELCFVKHLCTNMAVNKSGINLKELEIKLDDALHKETAESLNLFLSEERNKIIKKNNQKDIRETDVDNFYCAKARLINGIECEKQCLSCKKYST